MKSVENSEKIRSQVIELLGNFESELRKSDIREKVLSLVPVFKALRELGKSLIPIGLERAARDRILFYFQKYPFTVIRGDEILVISGIQDWPRRLRELRVQLGWAIIDGITAKEMLGTDDLKINRVDLSEMKPQEYILIDEKPDLEAAHRWYSANDIRKQSGSIKDNILEYFRSNVGKSIAGDELRYVSRGRTEWARRVRELRTELGWPIVTKMSGRPDMKSGYYMLIADRQSPEHDRIIPDSLRSEALRRDEYKCRKCGWSQNEWDASDPRHLELHHLIPHVKKGGNEKENLKTLCTVCHDRIHRDRL
jgi:hypothetical protein